MSFDKFRLVALPGGKSPRICFDPSSRESITSAFELYRPHSFKGKILKLAGFVLSYTGLFSYFKFFQVESNLADKLTGYSLSIKGELGEDDIHLAYLLGTPGKHQKWIARITAKNKLLGYAKIACASTAINQLKNEEDSLGKKTMFVSGEVLVPVLLASRFSDDLSFIIISGPEKKIKKSSPKKLNSTLTRFVYDLTLQEGASDSLVDECFTLEFSLSGRVGVELTRQRMLDWLSRVFSDNKYKCTRGHGDFAPWNVIEQTDKKLFVFDWEYSSISLPALFDLFHYTFMPAMLVENKAPVNAVDSCLELCKTGGFVFSVAQELSINDDEIPGYFGLYLWCLLIRLADSQEPSGKENSDKDDMLQFIINSLDILCYRLNRREGAPSVLVSAYACDPEHGSEPGVGWQMVQAISHYADEWVVTRVNNRENIERELLKKCNLHVYVTGVDLPLWLGWWKRGQRGVRTYYYLWQLVALYHCYKELKHQDFNLGHHVTFVNDWLFTFFALYKLPYIWGPIGSHPKIPYGLTIDAVTYMKDTARYLFQCAMRTIDPFFWISAIRAKKIIVISKEAKNRWPLMLFKEKIVVHTGIGVEEYASTGSMRNDRHSLSTRRLLSIGRLVQIKGFNLTLEAFARVVQTNDNVELIIIGKGAQKSKLIDLAKKLGVEKKVRFIDWLPRNEVLEWFETADIFLFPSFEAGGMVVLEAMSQSVPVVCLDYAGPGTMVDKTSGVKIQIASKEEVVRDLATAINDLLNDEAKLAALSRGAKNSTEQKFMWNKRIDAIQEWYGNMDNLVITDKKQS